MWSYLQFHWALRFIPSLLSTGWLQGNCSLFVFIGTGSLLGNCSLFVFIGTGWLQGNCSLLVFIGTGSLQGNCFLLVYLSNGWFQALTQHWTYFHDQNNFRQSRNSLNIALSRLLKRVQPFWARSLSFSVIWDKLLAEVFPHIPIALLPVKTS